MQMRARGEGRGAMIAVQTIRRRVWEEGSRFGREIELVAQLEPAGSGSDVNGETELSYEPLPAPWADSLPEGAFEGVHTGFGSVGRPLPGQGLRVTISRLAVSPPPFAPWSPPRSNRRGSGWEG